MGSWLTHLKGIVGNLAEWDLTCLGAKPISACWFRGQKFPQLPRQGRAVTHPRAARKGPLKRKSFSHVRLSETPWTVAHQAPLFMGFSRPEYWCGQPFASPGDLLNPGMEPRSPTLQVDSLPSEPPGKPPERVPCQGPKGKFLYQSPSTCGAGQG